MVRTCRKPSPVRQVAYSLARLAAAAALVALIVGPLGSGCTRGGLSTGDLAPDFILRDLQGTVRKLSNYRGKPVLVNLWATWCPPCIAEMPLLNRITLDYRERGLVVLGLAGDDDLTLVEEFMAEHRLEFQVLLDPDGAVGTQYGITGYPETFLIDREGRVWDKFIGPIPAEGDQLAAEFVDRLEALLGN